MGVRRPKKVKVKTGAPRIHEMKPAVSRKTNAPTSLRRPAMHRGMSQEGWREQVWAVLGGPQVFLLERELLKRLAPGQRSDQAWEAVSRLLGEGWLVRDPEGRLGLEQSSGELRVNPRGFGFVVGEKPPDVFVPARYMNGAVNGDRVLVWVRPDFSGPGPEGRVMAVLERGQDRVAGELVTLGGRALVYPRDNRLPAVRVDMPGVESVFHSGDMVIAEIVRWPDDSRGEARGRIVERLGVGGESGVDVRMLMEEHQLPTGFPAQVEQEAASLGEGVSEEEWQGREDLRSVFIVTIDGADAKDLDDAISVQATPEGHEIGVHIADVSHYVREGSPLDQEARARGTSVYLVDRVIPMLPAKLSNELASLNPHVPRLTLSAFMTVDRNGQVVRSRFSRSLIETRQRLTYDGVNRVLAGDLSESGQELGEWLTGAYAVAEALRRRRMARGAVDFDLPESTVELDEEGRPVQLLLRDRGPAQQLIEEFMLLANEAVATYLYTNHFPAIYRIHEPPSDEKLKIFREMIGVLGYRLPEKVTPKALQDLLAKVKGKPEERIVSESLLRSMKQAKYASYNGGHFGLASSSYTHFTSPIRRYPDLFVHRVLTATMAEGLTPELAAHWQDQAPVVADIASERERAAMEAERESLQMKQVQFMAAHIGESFNGIVSGVTSFGAFVELPDLALVEGLVRTEDLLPRGSWEFDAVHLTLTSKTGGARLRLGDAVVIQVARADLEQRRIDFLMAEPVKPQPAKTGRRQRNGGRRRTHKKRI